MNNLLTREEDSDSLHILNSALRKAVERHHFKKVNDDYGNSSGDTVLEELADRFETTLRSRNRIYRYRGDRMNDERIQVECYSGYRANERPKAFTFRGRRLEILDVVDCWYEGGIDPQRPQIDYFKVKAGDGKIYLLRYQSLFDAWSIHVCDTPAKMSP